MIALHAVANKSDHGIEAQEEKGVSVQLKDLGSGDIRVIEQVVDMDVGAEGGLLAVDGDCAAIGYMAAPYI